MVASLGDVNGDGYEDVALVGAATSVYHGSAAGLRAVADWSVPKVGSVAGGDVNGDGFDDLVLGDGGAQGGRGRAWVYLGSAAGLAADPVWTDSQSDGGDDRYGTNVATLDVNADGLHDIAISANDWPGGGRAFVYLGTPRGLLRTPSWYAVGVGSSAYHDNLGAGDLNGDGFDDLVIGNDLASDPELQEGAVSVYLGSAAGLPAAPVWTGESDLVAARFGWGVATGDVDGDGLDDLVVGAPNQANAFLAPQGAVYVYLGNAP
ncbi:MAG: VCBS repeat-containing protein [Myxococcales bacterium]|nr:VCBS repeat-containing protein [Myxococcales bacterium]